MTVDVDVDVVGAVVVCHRRGHFGLDRRFIRRHGHGDDDGPVYYVLPLRLLPVVSIVKRSERCLSLCRAWQS